MVTAIRSTASILAETQEIEPEWEKRFQRNLNEDSRRLAESTQQLVSYLDGAGDVGASLTSPMEEVEAMLAAHRYHFPQFEEADAEAQLDLEAFIAEQPQLTSQGARDLALAALRQLRADARVMPRDELSGVLEQHGMEFTQIMHHFRVSMATVFRRLAILSDTLLPQSLGLVMCDGSGTLMLRKPVEGFPVPRFSAACPKWPLFQALNRPLRPIRQEVTVTGREARPFECFAVTEAIGTAAFNEDPLYHSYMLVVPMERAVAQAREVGSSCRVCPSVDCEGRREPSILIQGL